MRCPRCGSPDHKRYRKPIEKDGRIYRRHHCLAPDCGAYFGSVETTLDRGLAGYLLDEIPALVPGPTYAGVGITPDTTWSDSLRRREEEG